MKFSFQNKKIKNRPDTNISSRAAVIPTLMATQKQIVQLGMRVLNANRNRFSGSVSLFGSPWNSPQNRFEYRQISQLANGKRACLVDTLALVINFVLYQYEMFRAL